MKRVVKELLAGIATSAVIVAPLVPGSAWASKSTGLGSASVALGVPTACSFPVTYTWTGFAGSNDTAALWIGDSLNGTVTGVFQQAKLRGSGGTVSATFSAGLVSGAQYRAWGELLDDHGNALLGSLVFSSFGSC